KVPADRARDPQLPGAWLLPEARLRSDRTRRRLSAGPSVPDAGEASRLSKFCATTTGRVRARGRFPSPLRLSAGERTARNPVRRGGGFVNGSGGCVCASLTGGPP